MHGEYKYLIILSPYVVLAGIIRQIIQKVHNKNKNPNWPDRRQSSWLFYNRGRGFELGFSENKSSKRYGERLELGAAKVHVPLSNRLATLPRRHDALGWLWTLFYILSFVCFSFYIRTFILQTGLLESVLEHDECSSAYTVLF